MDLEMVLNELSLRPIAEDVHDARQRMAGLVETVIVATKHGVKKILRTSSSLVAEELAPNYPVARWLNDGNVDRDLQRFFKTIVTKAPFLSDVNDASMSDSSRMSDYFFGESVAIGLGAAFLLDALAISLCSDRRWLESYLELRVSQLDDDGEIIDAFETIHHASVNDHVRSHLPWIESRLFAEVQSNVHAGLDIWLHKEEWFPNLYFCEQVKEQLQMVYRGHLMLSSILKCLHELEDYCKNWLDGPFDNNRITRKATLESAITLEMYGSERTFRCHDGISRLFSWHLPLTPNAWRLYFYPISEERKLIIGYIGQHLSTKLYPR
jgi:hypothetical protein